MKTISIVLIAIQFLTLNANADDAPMAIVQGGSVKPINNNDVQMQSETIDISLYKDYFTVDVNYTFVNKGKAQEVVMGFPSPSGPDSIYYFKAFEDKTELKIFQKETEWHYTPPATCEEPSNYQEELLNRFQCHSVYFQKNEIKKIKNSYKQRYNDTYDYDSTLLFHYVLKTGAFWKGKIESIEVRVHTENLPYYYNIDTACFNDNKVSLKNFYRKYTNIEPTEDLAFRVSMKQGLVPVRPSTTNVLKDSSISTLSNIVDGNPATAWVQSSIDPGNKEKIVFQNFYYFSKISGIGIINGYTKSQETFDNYGKVYCIEVEGWADFGDHYAHNDIDYGPKRIVYSFILKDIMEMQYLRFKCPIIVSHISFEIVSQHRPMVSNPKGYNEMAPKKRCAISEIKFLYEE